MMKQHLSFLFFISNLSVLLAKFYHGCGEKEETVVWKITKVNCMKKLKLPTIRFDPNYSYIVLTTECDIPESSENGAQSFQNRNEKNKRITCFPSKQIRRKCKHYIYYLIAKNLETQDKFSDQKIKKIVNYIAELYNYLDHRSNYDVTINKETFDGKTSEFLKLFPNDSDEELDGEENSELGINNPLLKLYILYEYKIVEIPFSEEYLNCKDLFIVYNGKILIVVKNRRNVDDIIEHLIHDIARYLKVESNNIECVNNFYDNESFMTIFNVTNRDVFKYLITENTRKEFKEHYRLYEFSDTDKTNEFDNFETGTLSSDLIQAENWYVLKNLKIREIFLYIPSTPNLKIDTMKFILTLGQEYASKSYKVSIVQPHNLHLSFIIAFKDLLPYILILNNSSEVELENEIKYKLCKCQ